MLSVVEFFSAGLCKFAREKSSSVIPLFLAGCGRHPVFQTAFH